MIPVRAGPTDMEAAQRDRSADLSEDIAAAIRLTAELPPVERSEADHQPGCAGDRAAAVRQLGRDQSGYHAAGTVGFSLGTAAAGGRRGVVR